jgi:hypothetical protein
MSHLGLYALTSLFPFSSATFPPTGSSQTAVSSAANISYDPVAVLFATNKIKLIILSMASFGAFWQVVVGRRVVSRCRAINFCSHPALAYKKTKCGSKNNKTNLEIVSRSFSGKFNTLIHYNSSGRPRFLLPLFFKPSQHRLVKLVV